MGVEKFRVEMFFNLSFIARWRSSSSFFLKISDFSYSCWLRSKAWPNISSLSLLSSAFWAQDFGGDDCLEPVSFQKKYFVFYTGKLFSYKLQKWQEYLGNNDEILSNLTWNDRNFDHIDVKWQESRYNYRTRAIITRGLYTFYPPLEVQKRFFKGL